MENIDVDTNTPVAHRTRNKPLRPSSEQALMEVTNVLGQDQSTLSSPTPPEEINDDEESKRTIVQRQLTVTSPANVDLAGSSNSNHFLSSPIESSNRTNDTPQLEAERQSPRQTTADASTSPQNLNSAGQTVPNSNSNVMQHHATTVGRAP